MPPGSSSFFPILGALAPIFLLIGLGSALRRGDFPGGGFWAPAERLTYYVLFPSLLVNNLAGADLQGLPLIPMTLALGGAFGCAGGVLILLRSRLGTDGPGFTSVFQGGIRMNTYVGIAGAVGLWGAPGLTAAAVAIAVIVPLVNVMSVWALYRYVSTQEPGWRKTAVGVVRNPLILACAAGIALNLSGIGLPLGIGPVLEILGRASLPLGLLCVGAGLELRGIRSRGRGIAVSAGVKLVLLPCLTAAACRAADLGSLPAAVAILFSALPSSASSYVLARQLGGDAGLMASILTVQTVLAAGTLPAALFLLA